MAHGIEVTSAEAFAAAEEAMAGPFTWGRSDCCTAACDAFSRIHAIDPMLALRGTYRSRQADRLLACRGGFLSLATELALNAGLTACGAIAGALGVAEHGGLMLGLGHGAWAMKGEDGLVIRRGWSRAWTCPRP